MSNAPSGRPTKNERREQAREQARELREQAKKRDRRNRILLQGGIIVVVLAIIAGVTAIIINNSKPAGPGPANMASGGVLLVSDGNNGIKVQSTAGLPDGAEPVDSSSSAQIKIQTFIDLTCPICQQFELGLDYDGDGQVTQDEVDHYNQLTGSSVTDDPSTLGDYVGNLQYIETLVEQGVASLEIFPVAILDRNWQGSAFSTRSANAFDVIAAGDPDHLLDFVQAMYENQPAEGSGSGLTDDEMISIAQTAGVDVTAQVQTGDGSKSIQDAIKAQSFKKWVTSMTSRASNGQFSAEANVDFSNGFGTPTVVVNDQPYKPADGNYMNNAEFKSFILQVAGEQSSSTPSPTPSDAATPSDAPTP